MDFINIGPKQGKEVVNEYTWKDLPLERDSHIVIDDAIHNRNDRTLHLHTTEHAADPPLYNDDRNCRILLYRPVG